MFSHNTKLEMIVYRKKRTSGFFVVVAKGLKKLYYAESRTVATEYVIITGLLAIALIGCADALAGVARLWFWRKALRIIKY